MEDRVSRTQFQYTLEDPNADELNTYAPQHAGPPARAARNCSDVASDQQVQGLRAQPGLRPRHRLAPGHYARHHRSDALRCLRPAAGLHHLHAVESVSRGARSEAGVPAESGRPAQSLHPHRPRDPPAPPRAWWPADLRSVHRAAHQLAPAPLPASTAAPRRALQRGSIATAAVFPPAARFRSAHLRTWSPEPSPSPSITRASSRSSRSPSIWLPTLRWAMP